MIRAAAIPSQPELRQAMDVDLGRVNAVIERAVMTWKLPADRDYPHRYWLDLTQHGVAGGCSDACLARQSDESSADHPT